MIKKLVHQDLVIFKCGYIKWKYFKIHGEKLVELEKNGLMMKERRQTTDTTRPGFKVYCKIIVT